ncbi:MAG: GTP 3',8-cyclase MoaA [Veillonella sp.]|nr:GTP 3',8-cyclase MoaA [Veillonella sp.]
MQDSWNRTIEYVRVSLTEACNFCCPYCRPEIITADSQTNLLKPEEWLVVLEAFYKLGINAVRLTGGEPLLYPGLETLLAGLQEKQWFSDISMTTNGSLLAARAERLHNLGLQRVNISFDAVDEPTFDFRTGCKGQMDSVVAGIEAAVRTGFRSVKLNTVLMETMSDDKVKALLDFMEQWPVVWRFIEYMPFQGDTYKGPTFEEWKAQLERVAGGPLTPVQTDVSMGRGPATYYTLPNGRMVGFIFPMSHTYCDSCNRVRLTSDGKLRLCLLRDEEVDLAEAVRLGADSETLMGIIADALQLRKAEHDGADMETPKRPMWRIGG